MPCQATSMEKFPKKFNNTSLRIVYKQYINISMVTKHLPRVTACTHSDLQVTHTDLGNTEVHEKPNMIYVQQAMQVYNASVRPRRKCHR